MSQDKTIWTAMFTGYEVLDNTNYRRLNFIDVRNYEGILIEKNFFINETGKLQVGKLNKNEIVCFVTADEKLENVIKFLPTKKEIRFEKKKDTVGLKLMEIRQLKKLKEKRKKK